MRAALDALHAIGEDCTDSSDFARRGVQCLPRLVSSELTTLSVCNLDSGQRRVVCDQLGAISRRELEVFDRYFDHPLVREHGRNPTAEEYSARRRGGNRQRAVDSFEHFVTANQFEHRVDRRRLRPAGHRDSQRTRDLRHFQL
jgi:hypothetical protein